MGNVMLSSCKCRTFVLAVSLCNLSACVSGGLYSDEQVREMTRSDIAASQQSADASLARQRFIRSCGGMHPLDRLEIDINEAYLNGKYGTTTPPVKYSKRCQDYRDGKITPYDAVRIGKGADEQ
jgi:hypothetical protein